MVLNTSYRQFDFYYKNNCTYIDRELMHYRDESHILMNFDY